MKDYRPISGKTYSLFGRNHCTQGFYHTISALADEVLDRFSYSEMQLLEYIQLESRDRRSLKRSAGQKKENSKLAYLLDRGNELLSEYTGNIEQHIRSVPLRKHFTDRELLSNREQYYLYMIEFELVNRQYRQDFMKTNFKIALLPHCLKESHTDCKASPDEFDYKCRGCIKTCYINRINVILREQDINTYILSRGRVSNLLKELLVKYGSIGVLGIACMVELVMGMRLCMKAKIPVVGIPLNANRCPRWMDSMHDTSIDLAALQSLIGG
ncbi:DUF116 domain-containing protein [Bacteroidota bacterium]